MISNRLRNSKAWRFCAYLAVRPAFSYACIRIVRAERRTSSRAHCGQAVNAPKSVQSNGQGPFWAVKQFDRGRSCEYRTNWSDHPLTDGETTQLSKGNIWLDRQSVGLLNILKPLLGMARQQNGG